jgi:hypothetical protein
LPTTDELLHHFDRKAALPWRDDLAPESALSAHLLKQNYKGIQYFIRPIALFSEKGFGDGRYDPMIIGQLLGDACRQLGWYLEIYGHQLRAQVRTARNLPGYRLRAHRQAPMPAHELIADPALEAVPRVNSRQKRRVLLPGSFSIKALPMPP